MKEGKRDDSEVGITEEEKKQKEKEGLTVKKDWILRQFQSNEKILRKVYLPSNHMALSE